MRTAIVTGVAGFIGSTLAERLLKNKFKVIGIDSFTEYYPRKIKQNNIKLLRKNKDFSFINKDILNSDLKKIFNKSDFLFHLAAQPGVRASWGKDFENYSRNNIQVTQKLLEYAKNSDTLKKIILASSSSVYGVQNGKMRESSTKTEPVSPYGVSKLAVEHLAKAYVKNFDLPIVLLRYFTVYGPKQRPDMAFMKFIMRTLRKKPIIVYGNGKQKRSFTYIDDIIDGTISSINISRNGEIINLGGGQINSINKNIEILSELLGREIKIVYKNFPEGDVNRTEADISKAKKLIGFKPKISLKEGLEFQCEFVKKNIKLYNFDSYY
tara:strand:- start:457 stop:1428 length:972 start_codon:yes stop_codon:yes gene_type:complete